MIRLFSEYRDQNEHRSYPFADAATLTSNGGTQLPVDFIIDLFLTPLDIAGPVYLSLLNTSVLHMEFTDAASGKVCAIANWETGAGSAAIVDTTAFARQLGVVVFGSGSGVLGESPMIFTAAATPILPVCAVPILQTGVCGTVTDDGLLTTGDIILEGRNGVQITATQVNADQAVIRVDIMGSTPATPQDCGSTAAIQTIRLVVEPGSRMMASPLLDGAAGPIICITGAGGFSLLDTCAKKQLPSADGTLPNMEYVAPVPPTPWVGPAETIEYFIPMYNEYAVMNGMLVLCAPSTLSADNPYVVRTEESAGVTIDAALSNATATAEQTTAALKQLFDTGIRPSGKITIALRGQIR